MTKNIYSVGQVNNYIKNMFAQDFLLHHITRYLYSFANLEFSINLYIIETNYFTYFHQIHH